MTNEKAIKILTDEIDLIKGMIYPSDMETTMWIGNRIEAIATAIKALEYKESKKPYHIHNVPYVWFCPTCNEQCGWTLSEEILNVPDFCPNCGQAISWGDYE